MTPEPAKLSHNAVRDESVAPAILSPVGRTPGSARVPPDPLLVPGDLRGDLQ
jgi:hypothetical protein